MNIINNPSPPEDRSVLLSNLDAGDVFRPFNSTHEEAIRLGDFYLVLSERIHGSGGVIYRVANLATGKVSSVHHAIRVMRVKSDLMVQP